MIKLDLGKFKKVSSDKHSTVLKHPDGHEIRVAHSALSPKMREQLHSLAMADGGPVPESSGQPDKGPSIGSKKDRAAVEKGATESGSMDAGKAWQNIKSGMGFAEGGEAKPYGNSVPENAAAEKIAVPAGGTELPARSTGMRSGPPRGAVYGGGGMGKVGAATKKIDDKEEFAEGGPVQKMDSGGMMQNIMKLAPLAMMALKEGGEVPNQSAMMADGGEMADSAQDSPDQIAADAKAQAAQPQQAPVVVNVNPSPQQQPQAPQQEPSFLTKAGNVVGQAVANSPSGNALRLTGMAAKGIANAVPQVAQGFSAGLSGQPAPAPEAPQAPEASGPIGASAIMPQAPQPNPMDQYGDMLGKGLHEQEAGIMQGAKAEGELGHMQAGQLQNSIAQQQQMMNDYQQHYSALDKERQAFQNDVQNQHIDPQHYMNNMGTGQKIKTAIGMIIAGMGSGVLHQENPVIKYVNQQISNDIDAQKSELGKKENLLSANMKQFGNLHDASMMTQVMQRDIVANQLNQAIAKMADPIAKAKAMQQLGQLHSQNALLMSQLAASRTLSGSQGNVDSYLNMMRVVNPERAKELESRYVPGMGIASVPLSEDARSRLIAKQNLHERATDMYNWASQHSGALDPRTVGEGKAKAAELQSMYRNAIQGGVFKKGEQEFIDNIVDSDPTKFFNSVRVLPKLKEIIGSNAAQLNTLKKAYGMAAAPGAQQQGQGFQPKSFRPIGK